jgi:integrase
MFEVRQEQLSNAKHLTQWPSTMETYVFPRIGDKLVADVTSADVIAILRPIWFNKAETARRVLQRIEAVFKSAFLLRQRDTGSPCYGVREQLGVKHLKVEHHRALPYAEVADLSAPCANRTAKRSPSWRSSG